MPKRGPSEHLTWKELACKDGTAYPQEYIEDGRVYRLAEVFEKIRALIGHKPITVNSGFRTLTHNRKIGGSRYSQHLFGKALDLKTPKGMTTKKFYGIIREYALAIGVRGLGKYKSFVHIDIRDSNKLHVWSGSGVKDSTNN